MTIARLAIAASLAATFAATPPALLAATPTPAPTPVHKTIEVHLPKDKLHAEYVVEVNKMGQVVKVKSGVVTNVPAFNTMTFGNAEQMWIRHPDGSATVGLFKVTYDYNPADHTVARHISLVSEGGDWGDKPGAANVLMQTAQKQYEEAIKNHQPLPSLNEITGKKTPAPSPTPTL